MSSRRASLSAFLALVVVFTVVPALASRAADPMTPAKGYVYSGLYTASVDAPDHTGADLDSVRRDFDDLAGWAGRRPTFAGTFQGIGNADGTRFVFERIWRAQATPFVNIEIHDTARNIASGKYDGQIRAWASGLKSWFDQGGDRSAVMAPLQEMNGAWTPWGCDPGNFKIAYRKFVDAFRAVGLNETKVRWVYAPNGWSDPNCPGSPKLRDYYPGDDVVDLVAISSYNYGSKAYHGWEGPDRTFGPYLDELRTFVAHKPYIVAQTGVAPENPWPGARSQWLRDMFTYLENDPNVVATVYFNLDKSAHGGNEWDWRVWYGGNNGEPGFAEGMRGTATAYAWPLQSWFQPGALKFGPVERAAGGDRIGTSVALSQRTFPSAGTVVIARAWDVYAHALLAGPLASKLGGPVLLSNSGHVDQAVKDELQRLGAREAVLIGGAEHLSHDVERTLNGMGIRTRRIEGANVFDIGAKIAMEVGGEKAYIVEGQNPDPSRGWPDAVSISALASYQQRPVLLVTRDTLPGETAAVLGEQITSARIVGGPVAVSTQVEDAVKREGVQLDPRAQGDTRYGTSNAVANLSLAAGMEPRRTWFATGTNYPDALTAGSAVARDGGVLHLVHGRLMEHGPQAREWLRSHAFDRVVLVGGPEAITMHVEGEARGVAAP